MIKLVLTDLDNTLVAHGPNSVFGKDKVSRRALKAIRAFIDTGAHFGPVTGRSSSSMANVFRDKSWAYATGAFANGQLIRMDGEVIHREWTPQGPLQRVVDILDQQRDGMLVLFDMEGTRPTWGVSRKYRDWPETVKGGIRIKTIACEVEGPTLKASIRLRETKHTPALRDLLSREVDELDFALPSPDAKIIDILPKGFGKGVAVRILADALGIGLDEVATFGDADNDVPMLEVVPNSVAVAGASPEAASAARWHIGDALEDSVAVALEDIAEATAQGRMPYFMSQTSPLTQP